jgi:DNA-binding CsgD family transcriptional regulator/tetratricopeptide (TPR) repeat protein
MIERRIHSSIDEAERLWHAAEYTRCLDLLSNESPSAPHLLLTAKCHLRLRRYRDAVAVLERIEPGTNRDACYRAASLAAFCSAARGDTESSTRWLRKLQSLDSHAISKRVLAEADNDRALCAWVRGDLIEAEAILTSADTEGDVWSQALVTFTRSFVRAKRGRLAEQAALVADALRLLKEAPTWDVGFMANASFALAVCAREVHVPEALPLVEWALAALPWTSDVLFEHFQTLRCSAWARALQGDYITAIRQLSAARDLAPSQFSEVFSWFDGARIAQIAGDRYSAHAQALDAFERASSLDWTKATGEEPVALLAGAEILASYDIRSACDLLDRFRTAHQNMQPIWQMRRDPRARALEAVTEATIAEARNDANAVRRSAKMAYDIYDGLGIAWRAARCSLQLYRAGAGDEWLAIAKERIADYPRSFVADEIERCERECTTNVSGELTARQREIFAMLKRGLGIDDVAATLACSPNTVRVHIGAIYRKLGVTNRIELLTRTG